MPEEKIAPPAPLAGVAPEMPQQAVSPPKTEPPIIEAIEPEPELLVLDVFLNTVSQGEFVFVKTVDEELLFPKESFQGLGFIEIPSGADRVYEGADYLSLSAIEGVSAKIDREKATLLITADPRLLKKQIKDLLQRAEMAPQLPRIPSAFLNYNIRYDLNDFSRHPSLNLPLELGISAWDLFGLSTFSYSQTPANESFQRTASHITWDDTKRLQRIVVGDITAGSDGLAGGLGGNATMAGISVSTNFAIEGGYFSPYAPFNYSGIVQTPSDVTLLLDGVPVAKEHFAPGPFEFKNVSAFAGGGEGVLIIRDAFGRETRTPLSYYYVSSLLKPRLQEYRYQIGAKREGVDRYGEMEAVGSHRIGITDRFTLGLRGEAARDQWNIGPTARFQISSYGDIDLAIASSYDHGQHAGGGLMTYGYGNRRFHLNASVSGFDRDYSNLSLGAGQDKARSRWRVGGGLGRYALGSVSASYQETDLYLGNDTRQVSLSYSKGWRRFSMRVSANRSFGVKQTTDLSFGISAPFQGKRFGDYFMAADQDMREERSAQTVFLNKNAPRGIGMGGSLRLINELPKQGENAQTAEGAFTYKTVPGIATANYRLREVAGTESQQTNVDWAGAFVATRGRLYTSRPISDGFALVTLDGIKDVRVLSQGGVSTITNNRGEAIFPDVHSYSNNYVALNDQDISSDYMISSIQKRFSIPYRAGVHLPFEATRLQGFSGVFSVLEGAVKTPAEYWGLGMTVNGVDTEVVIGKGGEFYLENMRPGKYPARLFTKGKECQFELEIPKSVELMVQMGEVVCAMP